MKRIFALLLTCVFATVGFANKQQASPINTVSEEAMQADLLQMLADFTAYMKADFQLCAEPNALGEACGCFKGENTMGSDEKGVRPNADLSMVCAFLVRYGRDKVVLPQGIAWEDLQDMAMKSLVFAYSTHKANRLKVCKGNRYWGSTSVDDHVWESSLWAMSVAYSAFFQWDRLSEQQRNHIYQLLKAECNYELFRPIPSGFDGDTKAEENGWEADVLAVTLGFFPNDSLAPQWFHRLRQFAINSYSQEDDASDLTVIDPHYDQTTVKDLYKGPNLYKDFTLQNHNYFHTSYQNVVIQELGEAALALKLFQKELHGQEKWQTNALMHNNQKVMDEVLYWLALCDGELAMPNGNDWSLFLYDQITSYTTNACFLRDPHALMLERLAYQMIKTRQQTTADGSWLLRPDVGARRMGVQAHRVMMTWLMHELLPTTDLTPTAWTDFCRQYHDAKIFHSQNIIRAATDARFTCFSWSKGLKSYTGYVAPTFDLGESNLIVPFRANNTGNFLGWYEIENRKTNAVPVVSGHYQLYDNSYVMNGELLTNDSALNHRFAIYSTPGNAVIYLDHVQANVPCKIIKEKGALMAISVDPFTKTTRTLYTADDTQTTDGTTLTKMKGSWVNIDQQFGIVTTNGKEMAFGERSNNNSILTARLYASYSDNLRPMESGEIVDSRGAVYYSKIDAGTTEMLSTLIAPLSTPEGWNGLLAFDPDSTAYLMLSNFTSNQPCLLEKINTPLGRPVLCSDSLKSQPGTGYFDIQPNQSVVNVIKFYVTGEHLLATQDKNDCNVAHFKPTRKTNITIKAVTADGITEKHIKTNKPFTAQIIGNRLVIAKSLIHHQKDKRVTRWRN